MKYIVIPIWSLIKAILTFSVNVLTLIVVTIVAIIVFVITIVWDARVPKNFFPEFIELIKSMKNEDESFFKSMYNSCILLS